MNSILVNGDKPISKMTVLRYHNIGLDERYAAGAPPTISMTLINCMRLHIKVLQVSKVILENVHNSFTLTLLFKLLTYLLYTVSKQGQASGSKIKRKLIAAAIGTCYEGFNGDWGWRRIRELWPDEISPSVVSQNEIICNEWTTYTKVNDQYEYNKKTLIESGIGIDTPIILQDVTEAELTIGETELRRIVNFDETDHPFTTENDIGG